MDEKDKKRIAISVIATILIDIIVFLAGNYISLFKILIASDNTYQVDNASLIGVIALTSFNIITIYHVILKFTLNGQRKEIVESVHEYVDKLDQEGKISEGVVSVNKGLKKVEVHLINYDCNTIAFSNLSAIEAEIGVAQQHTHNEIWVLTNNFEEINGTSEGCELRNAIIANLSNQVDYYYIIPSSCQKEIRELGEKLKSDIATRPISGKFLYAVDDALDFIPTPYFDIIMYLKLSSSGYKEDVSQIYYCFSRSLSSDDCFYLKVIEADIRRNMMDRTEKYRQKHGKKFKSILP